jgi:uncharacterized protein YbbC (DUF1343 family)
MRWGKRKSDYSSTPSYKKFERTKASLKNIKRVYKNSKYEVKTAKDALDMAKTNRTLQTEQIKNQDWTRRRQKKLLKTLDRVVDNAVIDVKYQKRKVKDIRRQLKDAKRKYRDDKKRRFDDLEGAD